MQPKRNRVSGRLRATRKGRNRYANLLGGVLLVVLAVAVILVLGFYVRVRDSVEHLTPALCPETGPTAALAILADLTDSLTETQRTLLHERLLKEVTGSDAGTRVTLGLISETSESKDIVRLRVCKPDEGLQANHLYQNPNRLRDEYRNAFILPVEQTLSHILSVSSAASSPIMEGIQLISVNAFRELDASIPRRLLLASDLLQHSDVFSFYRGDTWETFEASENFVRLGQNLKGVDVIVIELARTQKSTLDRQAVHAFWRQYFDRQGAASMRMEVLGDL